MTTHRQRILVPLLALAAIGMAAVWLRPVSAHCDGIDGPVIKAAQDALARNDVNLVLIWVRQNDEAEIRRAFEQTVTVRTLSPLAKDLADRYFFETLVRVHRTGEGAPYTGLKPAGRDLGPAIPAADLALRSGDITPLINLLVARVRTELLDRYKKVMAAKSFNRQDVGAGREYVEAYVTYIHFVDGIYEAAGSRASGHYPDGHPTRHGDK